MPSFEGLELLVLSLGGQHQPPNPVGPATEVHAAEAGPGAIDAMAPTSEGLVLSRSDFRPVGQVPLLNRGVARSSALLLRAPGVPQASPPASATPASRAACRHQLRRWRLSWCSITEQHQAMTGHGLRCCNRVLQCCGYLLPGVSICVRTCVTAAAHGTPRDRGPGCSPITSPVWFPGEPLVALQGHG